MSFKAVLVHRCSSSSLNEGKFFECTCQHRVTRARARKLVSDGHADWMRRQDDSENLNQIILIPRHWVPAATIAKGHIERAYIENRAPERERIEVYGETH